MTNEATLAATETFKQINIRVRRPGGFVDVLFGEDVDDPMPFIVTVSPEYVAHKTSKHLPTNTSKIIAYVNGHSAEIRDLALRTKVAGKNTLVL
jgi:hypothetical protein